MQETNIQSEGLGWQKLLDQFLAPKTHNIVSPYKLSSYLFSLLSGKFHT